MTRVGFGIDFHRFGGNRPVIIGGINIPHVEKIEAHSDGDVMIHAIIDSLLGAAGLGDIGKWFPNTNDKYLGINSQYLLKTIWKKIKNKYRIGNLDITFLAQDPKIEFFTYKIRTNLARHLNTEINCINIKATTTEYLGSIGRREGIACFSTVLLQ